MEMTTVKTVAVLAIIFACFAVLYPRIFHPMVLHMFGLNKKDVTDDDFGTGRVPPHMRHPGSTRKTMPDDISRHMRSGPHPGMRAAAEMKKQAMSQPGSAGGKGMMGVILPVYAIGIVVYLVYTLTKVFSKKDPKRDEYMKERYQDIRYDGEKKKFVYGDNYDEDEEEYEDPEFREYMRRKKQDAELDNLLKSKKDAVGAKDLKKLKKGIFRLEEQLEHLLEDDNPVMQKDPMEGEYEMQQLKRRLMETEAQMERILKAMETVQHKVGEQQQHVHQVHQQRQQQRRQQQQQQEMHRAAKNDSSPDLDSYEIVNGQHEESSSGEEIGTESESYPGEEVENIGPSMEQYVQQDVDEEEPEEEEVEEEVEEEEDEDGGLGSDLTESQVYVTAAPPNTADTYESHDREGESGDVSHDQEGESGDVSHDQDLTNQEEEDEPEDDEYVEEVMDEQEDQETDESANMHPGLRKRATDAHKPEADQDSRQ